MQLHPGLLDFCNLINAYSGGGGGGGGGLSFGNRLVMRGLGLGYGC